MGDEPVVTMSDWADGPEAWDEFVRASVGGTLYHERAFLDYHGDRFEDSARWLSWQRKGKTLGVMSLALSAGDAGISAASPFGASYGGPLFQASLRYAEAMEVAGQLAEYLRAEGAESCSLTLPPGNYLDKPSETFRLALVEHGFDLVTRDITSMVRLSPGSALLGEMESRRSSFSRKARKSREAGVTSEVGAPVEDLWRVIEATFAKHEATPTHTRAEVEWLVARLPGRVVPIVAYFEGQPVAGILEFQLTPGVACSFYLCQDPAHQRLQAQTLLITEALERNAAEGRDWYDLGTSSEGMKGRPNIFRFKEGFGANGFFRETYRWTAGG
jgi:hypothetical protein